MSTLICPLATDIGLYMWCVKESSFRRKRVTERIRFVPTTYSWLQMTSTSSIPEPIQSPTPHHIFSISLCYLFAQTLRYLPPTKRVTVVGGKLSAHVPPSLIGSSGPIIVYNPMCICAVVWLVAVSLHLCQSFLNLEDLEKEERARWPDLGEMSVLSDEVSVIQTAYNPANKQ